MLAIRRGTPADGALLTDLARRTFHDAYVAAAPDQLAIHLARAFGARVASRHEIPVYLYARAAARADRVKLSDVRRGQYEGLRDEIAQNGRQPDFGPARMHPRFGAVAVGVVFALMARSDLP